MLLIHRSSQASQAVAARMLTTTGDLIVEGVAVPRALRKALDQAMQQARPASVEY